MKKDFLKSKILEASKNTDICDCDLKKDKSLLLDNALRGLVKQKKRWNATELEIVSKNGFGYY